MLSARSTGRVSIAGLHGLVCSKYARLTNPNCSNIESSSEQNGPSLTRSFQAIPSSPRCRSLTCLHFPGLASDVVNGKAHCVPVHHAAPPISGGCCFCLVRVAVLVIGVFLLKIDSRFSRRCRCRVRTSARISSDWSSDRTSQGTARHLHAARSRT
jgi:hypothetical protein